MTPVAEPATIKNIAAALPLVSCICLTMPGREELLKQSVACYQRQTYPNRELIIVPDLSPVSVAARGFKALADAGACTVIYAQPGTVVGSKRNLGCQVALGEYIAVWDDDDHYAPKRLMMQHGILDACLGMAVHGVRRAPFQQGDEWWMNTKNPSHVIGSSLFFRRDWWHEHPFVAGLQLGEDREFAQEALRNQVLSISHWPDLMYVRRHAGNTWPIDFRNDPENWYGWQQLEGYQWKDS